jgi:hypothetical protein
MAPDCWEGGNFGGDEFKECLGGKEAFPAAALCFLRVPPAEGPKETEEEEEEAVPIPTHRPTNSPTNVVWGRQWENKKEGG